MKIIEELIERKNELGYTNEMISEKSGVPLSTVNKIFGRQTAKPRYNTLQSLHCVLFPEIHSRKETSIYKDISENLSLDYSGGVSEGAALQEYNSETPEDGYKVQIEKVLSWKKQGEYTVQDWLDLPDGLHMELIDGRLYDRNTPTTKHQFIAGELYAELRSALRSEKKGDKDCRAFIAPASVQPDMADDRNGYIPDVFIVCDKAKYKEGKMIKGAPDFVAEVLSPSTEKYDRGSKLNKYWQSGVREYWIIDISEEEVCVYEFGKGVPPAVYSFDDQIPLGISEGRITIDFKSISDYMHESFD